MLTTAARLTCARNLRDAAGASGAANCGQAGTVGHEAHTGPSWPTHRVDHRTVNAKLFVPRVRAAGRASGSGSVSIRARRPGIIDAPGSRAALPSYQRGSIRRDCSKTCLLRTREPSLTALVP